MPVASYLQQGAHARQQTWPRYLFHTAMGLLTPGPAACINADIHTYMHTYRHTYIDGVVAVMFVRLVDKPYVFTSCACRRGPIAHTYIQTYIHAYIDTLAAWSRSCSCAWLTTPLFLQLCTSSNAQRHHELQADFIALRNLGSVIAKVNKHCCCFCLVPPTRQRMRIAADAAHTHTHT